MVESIVSSGVAIGCIYALIGITYNVMFSASRVFSFTAGTLGMLGGIGSGGAQDGSATWQNSAHA